MTSLPLRLLALALAVVLVAAAPPEPPAALPETAAAGGPRCRAATALGGSAGEVRFRITCSFMANDVTIDPRVRVRRVRRAVEIERPDPEDRFACRRSRSGRRVRCLGSAGEGATVRGAFVVTGERCRADARFVIRGQPDCDRPRVCAAVIWVVRARDPRPSGCTGGGG